MRAKLSEKLTAAVDLALTGDWQGAHLVAQDHEGDELANWLHAVAHRMEGDLGNAGYWYRQAGKSAATGALDAEWEAIVEATLPQG